MYACCCRLIDNDIAGQWWSWPEGERHDKTVLAIHGALRGGAGRHVPRQGLGGSAAA
jgi:hypothetical protein